MKPKKKLTNAEIQDAFDTTQYSSWSVLDGKKRCKLGQLMYEHDGKNTWKLISENGIPKQTCNAISLDANGGSRMRRKR